MLIVDWGNPQGLHSLLIDWSDEDAIALSAGTLSLVDATPFVVNLSLATNSGGTAPYSNQLQRSLAGEDGWSNIGDAVVGATATFTDSNGLLANTDYDYRVLVTDDNDQTDYSDTLEVTTDVVPATRYYSLEGPAAAAYDLPGVPAITE